MSREAFLCLHTVLLAAVTACGAAPAPTFTPTPGAPPAARTAAPTTIAVATATPVATTTATARPQPTTTAVATATPPPTPIPLTRLIFTGDINPGRCVYFYAQQAGDMTLPYREVAPLLRSADLAIGSLDASLSDFNPPPPCDERYMNLMAPTETVQGMAYAGFDVMTVATNHIKDCGIVRGCRNESMFDTLATLRAANITPVGAGATLTEALAPAILTVNGTRFAFIGLSAINTELWATATQPGNAPLVRRLAEPAIRQARDMADVVIVLPHWGTEYSPRINALQARDAQWMVDAGAMLVVGNHPHRVQGVERFPNGAVVAYSLGNFVFDQQWSDGTLFTVQGVMVQADFRGAELVAVSLIPIQIQNNFQPRPATPAEAAQILAEVEQSLATLRR